MNDTSESTLGPLSKILTVVIPAHVANVHLETLLVKLNAEAGSLGRGALPVIVSDDAAVPPVADSISDTGEYVSITHVRSGENRGPGAARNRGLAEVQSEWVVFLDSDTVPRNGWLSVLLDHLRVSIDFDGVEGRVEVPEKRDPFTHATSISAAEGQHGGANVAYRVSPLREIGAFSERFYDKKRRIHFREDTELRFRVETSGRRVRYVSDLVVEHPPLARSLSTPVKLSRRYYFDPLLASLHPEQFREMNRKRSFLGYSMRQARHHSALAYFLGMMTMTLGLIVRKTRLGIAGVIVLLIAYLANLFALVWGRIVRRRDIPAVLIVGLLTPLTYLYGYYRGVCRFRHWPRM